MYILVKRIFDFFASLILFIVIFPIFLFLMILVKIKIGSPIFFKQLRTGKNGRLFYIRKFRSMTEEKDKFGIYLPDEMRLTKLGRFLRASSLDELPELLSIIKGDMSIIGPRPLPHTYDDYYTEREKHRFWVRSGLIPPEVLYGNVQPTWNEQLGYEAEYAEQLSFRIDVQVLFTVFKGLHRRYKNNYGEYVRSNLDDERIEIRET